MPKQRFAALLLPLSLLLLAESVEAQTALPAPEPASVVSADEWREVMDESAALDRLDIKVNETAVRGGLIQVNVLHRTRPETRALIHEAVTEIYHIVEGSGTLITGGTIQETRPVSDPPNLGLTPSFFATQVGGESRRVGPGDIIVIPAGVPHRLIDLDGPMSYLIYRFEGD